jgi:cellulose biosynthesis protein BcsQ
VLGILLNEVERNDSDYHEMRYELQKYFPEETFITVIRKNRGFKKSQKQRQTIFEYESSNLFFAEKKGSDDFLRLSKEIEKKIMRTKLAI